MWPGRATSWWGTPPTCRCAGWRRGARRAPRSWDYETAGLPAAQLRVYITTCKLEQHLPRAGELPALSTGRRRRMTWRRLDISGQGQRTFGQNSDLHPALSDPARLAARKGCSQTRQPGEGCCGSRCDGGKRHHAALAAAQGRLQAHARAGRWRGAGLGGDGGRAGAAAAAGAAKPLAQEQGELVLPTLPMSHCTNAAFTCLLSVLGDLLSLKLRRSAGPPTRLHRPCTPLPL